VLYLLDANVLITAHNQYYPLDRVPEFWGWIHHVAIEGHVKMPAEIFDEIKDGTKDAGKDLLYAWIQDGSKKDALVLVEEPDVALVQKVINEGYANDLTDNEIEQLGRDPFLVAYALVAPTERCIVTTEVSKPSRTRQNRHVPDVCDTMNVKWYGPFDFLRVMNFSTNWKK
jgi:hypothetical protein